MIFYVYMSPDVIEDANDSGPGALDSLIGILQSFLQNCFIAEFEDGRFQRTFYHNINLLPVSPARNKLLKLLGELKRRNHFICCLAPDYFGADDDLSCAIKQAEDVLLDLLLIARKENFQPLELKAEITMLDNYNQSNFASSRSELAKNGMTLKPDQLEQSEFLDKIFKKALMYASRIEICDRILTTS